MSINDYNKSTTSNIPEYMKSCKCKKGPDYKKLYEKLKENIIKNWQNGTLEICPDNIFDFTKEYCFKKENCKKCFEEAFKKWEELHK